MQGVQFLFLEPIPISSCFKVKLFSCFLAGKAKFFNKIEIGIYTVIVVCVLE